MTTTLSTDYNDWLQDLMVRRRVILRRKDDRPTETVDPDAIVSTVPQIWVDQPTKDDCGRRRALRMETDGLLLILRTSIRKDPLTPDLGEIVASTVKNRLGESLPASIFEAGSRIVRLAFDPGSTCLFPSDETGAVARSFFRALLEVPIEAILATDVEPTLGARVRQRVHAVLSLPCASDRHVLLDELRILEHLAEGRLPVPEALQHRLQSIKARIDKAPGETRSPDVPESELERQVASLARLVRARACARLAIGEGVIEGIVNPSTEGLPSGRAGFEFRIVVGTGGSDSGLMIAPLSKDPQTRWRGCCLGAGESILQALRRSRDLCGLVDFALNYVETNQIFAHRAPRRSSLEPDRTGTEREAGHSAA